MKLNKNNFLEFDLFFNTENLKEKIFLDYNVKIKNNSNHTIMNSLMSYINKYLIYSNDTEFKIKNKFARNAQEIWDSGLSTGCTDYAIVFANFARQLEIPTTILHTMSEKFVNNAQNNLEIEYVGHAFCECFYNNEWVLVDPTGCKVIGKYCDNKIELAYSIHCENIFIPLERTDKVEKQNIKQFNEKMLNLSKNYDLNKII